MHALLLALALANGWSHSGRPMGGSLGGVKDTGAPVTTILTGPSGATGSTSATFTFSANEPSTFMCTVDLGSASCTSPATFNGLSSGSHTFTVTATDSFGNVELSPPSRTWMIHGNATDTTSLEWGGVAYASIGQPANLNVTPSSGTISFSAWFQRGEAADGQKAIIARARMDGGDVSFFMGVTADEGIYVLAGGGENTSGGDISDHGWHLATFTLAGGTGRLYLDDTLVGSPFAVGSDVNSGDDWTIGAARWDSNSTSSYEYIGQIDEVSFWSVQLSAAEVAELYNGGTPLDARTHSRYASLTHYYPMGDGDTWPTLIDVVGGATGTAFNTPYIRYAEEAPQHNASALSNIDDSDSGVDLYFNATAWDGSGNWTASKGSWTGVKTGSPVKSETSLFSGHYQASCAGWFRVANDAAHRITGTHSFRVRMYTGSLNGSGGFFMGYDATVFSKSNFEIYNFFYDKDWASRLRTADNSADYLVAESHNSQHANSYIEAVTTINLSSTRIRTYVNGALLAEDTSTTGSYDVHTTAPLGICGIAYSDAGGFNSTAAGQKIMEVARYTRELTAAEIMAMAVQWNGLKGYVRNVSP